MYHSKPSVSQNTQKNRHRTRIQTKPRSAPRETDSKRLLLGSIKAALLSVALGILLLLLLCAVALSTDDPVALVPILSRAALIPPALFCGILGAYFSNGAGILSGAVSGVFMIAVLFALGLVIPSEQTQSPGTTVLLAGVCVLLSCIGGYLHTHRRQRPKRKKRT